MLHAPDDDARGDAEALRKGFHVGVGFQICQFGGPVGRDKEVRRELVGLLLSRVVARVGDGRGPARVALLGIAMTHQAQRASHDSKQCETPSDVA
jgi:hypothetical protein